MSQRKTAEEILKHEILSVRDKDGLFMYSEADWQLTATKHPGHKSIIEAMQEFAKQEVEARDELIKEMVNALEETALFLDSGGWVWQGSTAYKFVKAALTKAQSFNQE